MAKINNSESTFLDGLFGDVAEKRNIIAQETVRSIIQFMRIQQYDSDAFKDDVNTVNNQQSNLYKVSNQNADFLPTSKQFINKMECMSSLSKILYYLHVEYMI